MPDSRSRRAWFIRGRLEAWGNDPDSGYQPLSPWGRTEVNLQPIGFSGGQAGVSIADFIHNAEVGSKPWLADHSD